MPDRTVRVMLIAHVAGYIAGMREAEAATSTMSSKSATALAKHRAAFETLSRTAGVAMLGTAAAIGVMVGVAIKKFADFDAEMANVAALTHGTADEMEHLRQAAMKAGQQFGFSATEVAQAEQELVKAGISVKDILGGALPAALTIAADGQMDVGNATQIAAEAMTQFQLQGKDLPHVADLLAAGADKALGSVGDLGFALESGGLVAHQFGLSIDGTIGTLAAFAQAGLIGEQGGTVLRQMFLKLAAPSSSAKKLLDQYNISLYNSQGNFVGVANLAGQLHDKLSGVDQATRNAALSTIFGARAIQGANVLYQDGAKGIQGWIDKVNDQGFAAQQASDKLNSLEGDLQKLRAAFDTAMISAGSAANGPLRSLTEGATDAFNAFSGLPPWLQKAGLGFGAVSATALALGGAFLLLLPRIVATRAAMDELGISTVGMETKMRGAASFIVNWGGSIAIATTSLGLLIKQMNKVGINADHMQAALSSAKNGGEVLAAASRSISPSAIERLNGVSASFTNLGSSLDKIGTDWKRHINSFLPMSQLNEQMQATKNGIKALGDQLAALAQTNMPATQSAFKKLSDSQHLNDRQMWELISTSSKLRDAFRDGATKAGLLNDKMSASQQMAAILAFAVGKTGDATNKAAGAAAKDTAATMEMDKAAQKATDDLNALVSALAGFGSQNLDASGAAIAFQQAIDNASEAVKKNGKTLDIDSQKGRDNQSALDAIASSAVALVSKQANAGASAETLTKQMETARSAFIRAAEAAGLTASQAADLADKYGLIPADVTTELILNGYGDALGKAKGLYDEYNKLRRDVRIPVTVTGVGAAEAQFNALYSRSHMAFPTGAPFIHRASGGILPGAPSRKDNVLIAAATGEFVVNSIATAANRRVLEYINAGGRVPGFATGGQVGPFVSARQVLGPQVFASPAPATVGVQPLIGGDVIFPPVANGDDALAKLNFALRVRERGGRGA